MIFKVFLTILLIGFAQSPFILLFINEKKQKQYREELQNISMPDYEIFEMPNKLWLFTLKGILTSCTLFLFFLSLALAITHIYLKHVYLPNVIEIFAILWFSFAVIIPLLSFTEHKKDRILIGIDRLECKIGSKSISIPKEKLRIVEKKSFFLLYSETNKKFRIYKSTILSFISGDILQKRMRELIVK